MTAPEHPAFYLPDDDRFVSTPLTAGPWDPSLQHAGPPAALLAHVAATAGRTQGRRIARITCEVLRPIPVAPVTAAAIVSRPGETVELVEAELRDADGRLLVQARVWRLPDDTVATPDGTIDIDLPVPPPPEEGRDVPFFPTAPEVGYHTAMDWRFTQGSWREPGPGCAWSRMRVPLIGGTDPTPIERVLVAADSTSGLSHLLDPGRYQFMNVDLTVTLHRDPRSDWVALDATTDLSGTRTGLARSFVHDRDGPVGLATQTLLVTDQGPPDDDRHVRSGRDETLHSS